MLDHIARLFAANDFLPHGYCISWSGPLLSTFVVSDVLIFVAYFSMPVALMYFARRRTDFPYHRVLWMFAAFILACGTTHLLDAIVLWWPLYWLSAVLKALTALVSLGTAIALWPLIPRILKLPSPAQLRQANQDLQQEIVQRGAVEKALRLLSESNRLLFRASDEQVLLNDVCKLLVGTGGYLMAWVGFAEDDAEKSVRAAAQAGYEEGYLSAIRVSWADTELGRGPTGSAIRERATQVNQDCLTNPRMLPWREAALRRGYQSSIALPLVGQERVLGALMIYSVHPGAFGAEEVKLLEELANNLAYGIEALRMRAQKAMAEAALDAHRLSLESTVAQRTAELAAAKLEAERANNAKSQFLAAASHDLRQPLSALSLYVGVLKGKLPPAESQLATSINDCVGSLSEMLSNLLDLSKLDAGAVVPSIADFSVDEKLAKVVASHAPEAQAKGLVLRYGYLGLVGRSDPVLYGRILDNLLANAIRYSERGGVLLVCRRREGRRWIEVWDTGIGIPADKTEEIFEAFKQLGNHQRDRSKGTGLGLAIVAKTAALLGLRVRVHSRLGKGSMFAVELPIGEAVEPSHPKPYAHRPLRIALIEDNLEVAAAMHLALTNIGHEVVVAASRIEILQQLGGRAPDIVVSDYRLSGREDGIGVIAALRVVFGEALPAIIVTGDTDPAVIRRMAEAGVVVQHKPLNLDALRERLAALTGVPEADSP